MNDQHLYECLTHFLPKEKVLVPDSNKLIHTYYHDSDAVAQHILNKEFSSLPKISSYEQASVVLGANLLFSPHVILSLPSFNNRPFHWVKYKYQRSMYDGMGAKYDVHLNFGDKELLENIVEHGGELLKNGVLSIVPDVTDRTDYDCDPDVYTGSLDCFRNYNSILPTNACHKMTEIFIPIIYGAKLSDILKLISDEWESYEMCRNLFFEAYLNLSKTENEQEFQYRLNKIKKDVIEDGVDKIRTRYNSLKRKGIVKAMGAVIGASSLMIASNNINMPNNVVGYISHVLAAILATTGNWVTYVDYKDDLKKIQSDPSYLLWKIGRA